MSVERYFDYNHCSKCTDSLLCSTSLPKCSVGPQKRDESVCWSMWRGQHKPPRYKTMQGCQENKGNGLLYLLCLTCSEECICFILYNDDEKTMIQFVSHLPMLNTCEDFRCMCCIHQYALRFFEGV